jgi:hypothetical protein
LTSVSVPVTQLLSMMHFSMRDLFAILETFVNEICCP